ncbi:hypothetical protein BUALT_Bualt11G0017600 [Buddleja alternifolia]|uniref:Myb/SANT-like domain-containing protein n=1 Tax=Buddleja alternifolia TaxID=168488 RepID=A0AAV6WTF9_9LAMI|nr:hypothetical protein BUALT_Bualt11G0017600 [Buddleja alternifolia]
MQIFLTILCSYKQMESSSSQISKGKGPMKTCDQSRRSWTRLKDEVLLTSLKEIVATEWKLDNGFRTRYLHELEQAMIKTFPDINLHAQPHINSKSHTWKKQYGSLFIMMNKNRVGWNETTGMLETTDEAWERVVRFGKDKAIWEGAKDIVEPLGGLMNDKNQEENLMGEEADQQKNVGDTKTTSMNENAGSSSSKKRGDEIDSLTEVVVSVLVGKIGDALLTNCLVEHDAVVDALFERFTRSVKMGKQNDVL